jgi:acetyl esterase/lipase
MQRAVRRHLLRRRPARNGPVPAIVYVHGGGWHPQTYLDAGYVVLSIEYRLTADPFKQTTGITFPENLIDVKTALRWLRAKAAGFVDGNHLLAYGFSAGAHLVSVLGTTTGVAEFEGCGDPRISSAPTAVVGLSTPLDLHLFFRQNPPLDGVCPSQLLPVPTGTPADDVSLVLGVAPADFETLAGSPKLEWVSAMKYASPSSRRC